jgi:uncharacterized protein YbcC (UPF0753/DUF2309 family)
METIESPLHTATSQQPSPVSLDSARAACARIAPLWPLQHFVAVNPFVGLSDRPITDVCDLMQRLVPGGMQMPAGYYTEKIGAGSLSGADLANALGMAVKVLPPVQAQQVRGWTPRHLREILASHRSGEGEALLLTVAEALDRHRGTKWTSAIVEAIGRFCAAYFDAGQSAWRLPWTGLPLFQAWREYASLDAAFEMLGLPDFRAWVKSLPADAESALSHLLPSFRLEEGLDDFLHKQLLTIRGWAGYVQYGVRDNGMHGRADDSLFQLLAIRVALDAALLARFDSPAFREFWPLHGDANSESVLARFVGQLADEHAWQRQLFAKLHTARAMVGPTAAGRPAAQAVFCIDVRSEIFRRALESAAPKVQTLGFAGFFGLPIETVPFGQRDGVPQCPVLLTPKYRVRETLRGASADEEQQALRRKRLGKRITHSWNSFKNSAISCFSFVETAGLAFGAHLFRSAFAPGRPAMQHDGKCGPVLAPDAQGHGGIPLADRVTLGLGALRNMGLTHNFGRLVLLCGHGSATTNNPYAAGLDCGACGGHAGDTNARVGAAILNDPAVRAALAQEGVAIPEDTWFLGGLHNTTTDEVTLFDLDLLPESHREDLTNLQSWLAIAGGRARKERAALLGLDRADANLDVKVSARSRDWAQVRPEWGLAGNAAFIAAPRARTQGAALGGRAFLHDYDHRADADNSTLELIMCAPMVVANWINLQYFASTVNNAVFGSGNKVIHNVVGTLGVCLGNGGDLQTGLPLQSVHDGERWIHEPLRLHVLLEAPRARIEAVLAKHEAVRHLVEHGWLLLFAIEDEGAALHRYLPGKQWEPIS